MERLALEGLPLEKLGYGALYAYLDLMKLQGPSDHSPALLHKSSDI